MIRIMTNMNRGFMKISNYHQPTAKTGPTATAAVPPAVSTPSKGQAA